MMETDPKPKRVYTKTGLDTSDMTAYYREYGRRRRQDPAYKKKKAQWSEDWTKGNPEKQAHYVRRNQMRHRYHMTVEDYEAMKAAQDNRCAICGDPPGAKRLFVDHSHTTGRVRALLCQQCNTMLGMAKDTPERLDAAAAYLRKHSPQE